MVESKLSTMFYTVDLHMKQVCVMQRCARNWESIQSTQAQQYVFGNCHIVRFCFEKQQLVSCNIL